jgi:hypothetical protein
VAREQFSDSIELARFHDALLFLRAFPPNAVILKQAETLLQKFAARVERLKKSGAHLSDIEDDEAWSGIVGTTLTGFLNFDETAWLVKRFPGKIGIDWDSYENAGQMGFALPRFLPLLEEDAAVEADVPYRKWIDAASRRRDLAWLVDCLGRMDATPERRLEIFGGLGLPIRWQLGNSRASRTLARMGTRRIFFHHTPLIQRREVSLIKEIAAPGLKLEPLSSSEGRKIIDFCRDATTVRYRELYGTSLGDPTTVVRARVGRGVEIYLWGLLPERRLPLRAYQAGFTVKSGVPINYIEGIALFEWMEIGFNTFYAYRDGETAWIYAQVLRALHQRLGVTCISVYPYQLGKDNEEAIASGAFWFYRKLGFRPMRPELKKLAEQEERKIVKDSAHRTSAPTLRRLAEGHVVLELPGGSQGDWDGFAMRNIGFAVERHMASRFGGDAARFRRESEETLAKELGVSNKKLGSLDRKALSDFSALLSVVPTGNWSAADRSLLERIIRAKAQKSDDVYLRLLQKHETLRKAVLRLGTGRHLH